MKKRAGLILCLALACLLAAGCCGAAAAEAAASWREIYEDFLTNGLYFFGEEGFNPDTGDEWDTPIRAGLRDMDRDGIPELVMFNGSDDMAGGLCNIYTVRDGRVRFCGYAERRECVMEYCENDQYPGLFCTDGNMGHYTTDYYSLSGMSVVTTEVCGVTFLEDEETGETTGVMTTAGTDNPELSELYLGGMPLHELRTASVSAIRKDGLGLLADFAGEELP